MNDIEQSGEYVSVGGKKVLTLSLLTIAILGKRQLASYSSYKGILSTYLVNLSDMIAGPRGQVKRSVLAWWRGRLRIEVEVKLEAKKRKVDIKSGLGTCTKAADKSDIEEALSSLLRFQVKEKGSR